MLGILIHQRGGGLKRLMRHSSSPVFMRSGDRPALANIRRGIGHRLTPHLRDVAGDLGGRLHKEVAQGSGDLHIVRSQRDPHPLLGVVVVVNRVVAPVSAVVVPDVVVGIRVFIFHAPTATQGVGHPLSHAQNLARWTIPQLGFVGLLMPLSSARRRPGV